MPELLETGPSQPPLHLVPGLLGPAAWLGFWGTMPCSILGLTHLGTLQGAQGALILS